MGLCRSFLKKYKLKALKLRDSGIAAWKIIFRINIRASEPLKTALSENIPYRYALLCFGYRKQNGGNMHLRTRQNHSEYHSCPVCRILSNHKDFHIFLFTLHKLSSLSEIG